MTFDLIAIIILALCLPFTVINDLYLHIRYGNKEYDNTMTVYENIIFIFYDM